MIEFNHFPKKCSNVMRQASFEKKIPDRTYIMQEEKAMPVHKPMQDRLTFFAM